MSRTQIGASFLIVALMFCSASKVFANAPRRAAGERYALLVGVRSYDPNELRALPYAEADVEGLARVLRYSGYKSENIVLMTQRTGAEQTRFLPLAANIRKELALLLSDRTEDDRVIVALAGHGVQFREGTESFFCPVDARLADKSTLVSLREVYDALEHSKAGLKVLLVDACRNDPQSDNSRSRSVVSLESVSRPQAIQPPGGVVALFSCSAGEKAFENADLKHGVFFNYVIEALQAAPGQGSDGEVTVPDLEKYVKRHVNDFVRAKYGVRQMPERLGEERGLVPLLKIGDPRAAFERGRNHVRAHELREALADFEEALRLDPYHAAARYYRTQCLCSLQKSEALLAECEANLRLDPRDPIALAERAHVGFRLRDYDRAIMDCGEAIQCDPKNGYAYRVRGFINGNRKDLDRAIADFSRAIQIDPADSISYDGRGLAFHKKGDESKAVADFDEAIRLDPGYVLAHHNRGLAYKARGELDKALADFTEAIRIDPKRADDYFERGSLRRYRGDLPGALDDLNAGIQIDPKRAAAYNQRGLVFRARGEADRALTDFNAAIRINSKDSAAYNNRGQVFVTKGETDKALADFNTSIRIDPKHVLAYESRGKLRRLKGDLQGALDDFNTAIQLDPRSSAAHRLRAFVYDKLGQPQQAKADREKAASLAREAKR